MLSSNIDLLTIIFLNLPTKTLIRFKLVCKLWHSLISTHHFSNSHTLRHVSSKPNPTLLFHTPKSQHFFLFQNSKLTKSHFSAQLSNPTICSFSNGLFLLRCDDLQSAPIFCVIYNPTTRDSRKVLLNVVNDVFTCVVGLNIAYDPLKLCFKIVCVRSVRRRISGFFRSWNRRCRIEVFDSGTCEWTVCGEQFIVPSELDFDRGVYWNDGVHWQGIFFDFNTMNVCRQPVVMGREDYVVFAFEYYVEVNGSLNCILHFGKENLVEVFELKRGSVEWVLKCRVSVEECSGRGMCVLGIEWGESEGDGVLVVYEEGKVMSYGFREKVYREVGGSEVEIFEKDSVRYYSRFSFQFMETLAPV